MPVLQDWIHRLEVGAGAKAVKWGVALLVIILLLAGYNWRSFKNLAAPEAMDAAQLARNLAEGKGYTTLFLRPFSLHLVKKVNEQKTPLPPVNQLGDLSKIKGMHPDLANPPVYPCVLAGLMKMLPFKYEIPGATTASKAKAKKSFWQREGRFWWYPPDFFIGLFNQLLFLVVVLLTGLLARRLFDAQVAWLSAILLLGTELFWRFSVSGLSTMLLLVLFMALLWGLALLEQAARTGKWGQAKVLLLTIALGVLVGMGALTRYAFAWLIFPVLVFVLLFSGQRRVVLALAALLAFSAVLSPWVVRNFKVSGTPFGTASFAPLETTAAFPESKLGRSLNPDFSLVDFNLFWRKLLVNTRQIVQNDLPKLGGSWVTAFFLVGLLVTFHNPTLNRLRYFLLLCLALLTVVQAEGRTQLSEDSPEINSENLLVLLAPLVLVYGVSLFYLLLEQVNLPIPALRYLVIGAFAVVVSLPMIFTFLPPRPSPVAYPPYYPPAIQTVCGWMNERELMMSDIPWAVAWYGKRQCVWLTLNANKDPKDPDSQENFFTIYDYQKPIQALYLTPQTMDSRFLSQWVRPGELSWGSFILESMVRHEIPPGFPLRKAPAGFLPEQLFLTDWERWRKPGQ